MDVNHNTPVKSALLVETRVSARRRPTISCRISLRSAWRATKLGRDGSTSHKKGADKFLVFRQPVVSGMARGRRVPAPHSRSAGGHADTRVVLNGVHTRSRAGRDRGLESLLLVLHRAGEPRHSVLDVDADAAALQVLTRVDRPLRIHALEQGSGPRAAGHFVAPRRRYPSPDVGPVAKRYEPSHRPRRGGCVRQLRCAVGRTSTSCTSAYGGRVTTHRIAAAMSPASSTLKRPYVSVRASGRPANTSANSVST